MFKKIELYYYDACPFCQLVLNTIKKLNLKIDLKNTMKDSDAFDYHVKATGRRTVPCLYIDNKPMFESSDIVNWLNQNEKNIDKN